MFRRTLTEKGTGGEDERKGVREVSREGKGREERRKRGRAPRS